MGKYFKYPKYNENHDLPFGARILKPGDNGNDVLIFQNILRKYNSSLPLTGEFDKDTFQIYVQA